MKYYKALLFGSIGSIVETSEIQRRSFNEAFKQYGLEWNWTKREYLSLLSKSGGKDRISRYAKKKKDVLNSAYLRNSINKRDFNFIGNVKLVKKLKPNPDIYLLTLKKLKLKANDCVAIEDTQESLNSARRAKIKCIIFPGKFHSSRKFIGAYKKVYRLNRNIILR